MTKELSKELQTLLGILIDNLEEKEYDIDLTSDQITCLRLVADAIDETIKEYLE